MTTSIRRYIETDTGHRVPNHKSKCRHFHGHRYRWEAEIEGEVVTVAGASDEGMLIDFGDVSAILTEFIHAPDLGRLLSQFGKRAKRMKGVAKVAEKASMPSTGQVHSLLAVAASSPPTNGAVQENETSVRVRPMKSTPMMPDFVLPWSLT